MLILISKPHLKKILEPAIKQAKAGQRYLFFMDAAHFVHAPFLGHLWSFSRIFIKAPSGRKRFNVLGALNAINHEMIIDIFDRMNLVTLVGTHEIHIIPAMIKSTENFIEAINS